ncbi:hypothetical protein J5N97_027308 [Dioscorea zingiberensis]|uniref:Senescence regulator n=1 Tax=Dioscorea zingiberensis TaxID=325984 RepID=A0A9D5C3Y9_9LILI|nr:hypothetical protein J5N97_027308 [Dioscorea zingiberensis]
MERNRRRRRGFWDGLREAMADSEEFEEEEVVWAAVKERVEVSPKTSTNTRRGVKAIPRSNASVEIVGGACQQSSAPVTIPDWSKIHDHAAKDSEDEDEDDEDVKNVPPHEWLAKKLARSQISSFSVCEGAGRTLKGRDLSRVRNAVLTRTGFLE